MEPAGASAEGALDAPPAATEPQTELGARLQELVRQAEAQAQQVRRAREPRALRLPDPRACAAQLELEGRTRAELEDVLQRIERHFRSEQAVRRRAEESEREASGELARERELRVRLEEEARVGVACD